MFNKKKTYLNDFLLKWKPSESLEDLKEILIYLCKQYHFSDIFYYKLVDNDWFVLELDYKDQVDDSRSSYLADVEKQKQEGEGGKHQESSFSMEEGHDDHLELFLGNGASRIRFSERFKSSSYEIRSYFGVLYLPLYVNGQIFGLLQAKGLKNNWKKKYLSELEELATHFSKIVYLVTELKNEKEKSKEKERDAGMSQFSIGATISMSRLIETIIAQCARSLHFNGALLASQKDKTEIKAKYSWNISAELLDLNLFQTVIEVIEVENQTFYAPVDEDNLRNFGIDSILVMPLGESSESKDLLIVISTEKPKVLDADRTDILKGFCVQLANIMTKEDEFKKFEQAYLETLSTACESIEISRPAMRGHHQRVKDLALKMAKGINLSSRSVKALSYAAEFHDIGLLSGKGNDVDTLLEFQHPEIGQSIVTPLPDGEFIGTIIVEHHETYDGFGFPRAKSGDLTSIEGQILNVSESIVERMTASLIAEAESIQEVIGHLKKETGARYGKDVATVAIKTLENERDYSFVGEGACSQVKKCPQSVCKGCAAFTSEKNCWELSEEVRNCRRHGDFSCKSCFVFKTWGHKGE